MSDNDDRGFISFIMLLLALISSWTVAGYFLGYLPGHVRLAVTILLTFWVLRNG